MFKTLSSADNNVCLGAFLTSKSYRLARSAATIVAVAPVSGNALCQNWDLPCLTLTASLGVGSVTEHLFTLNMATPAVSSPEEQQSSSSSLVLAFDTLFFLSDLSSFLGDCPFAAKALSPCFGLRQASLVWPVLPQFLHAQSEEVGQSLMRCFLLPHRKHL